MNKQKLLTILILLLTFTFAKGQDIIITTKKDTIFCKIISISPTHIQFEQKDNTQNTVGRFFAIEQVLEYYRDAQLKETSHGIIISKRLVEPFPRWRIGIQGGGSHLLSSFTGSKRNMQSMGIPQSQINDYHKRIRNGTHFGADVHYLITPFLGIGLMYSLFTNSIQMDLTIKDFSYYSTSSLYDPNALIPIYYSVSEKEKSYVNYVGPSVVFQHWLDKNHKFQMSEELSLGYAYYREEDRFDPYKYTFYFSYGTNLNNMLTEGSSWGGNISVAFDYYPSSWLSIGMNVGYFNTTFRKVNISSKDISIESNLDKANYLNLSHLDYSIGVCLHF